MAEGSGIVAGGVELTAPPPPGCEAILSPAALALLAELERRIRPARLRRLARRAERQAAFDAGELPDFRPDTAELRGAEWTVAETPARLLDRRVEITGPVDRKMIINALNSGARVFMADFEDSLAPTWEAVLEGQRHLRDAVAGTIEYRAPDGRLYRLGERPAHLIVRPRGWHLVEKHLRLEGRPVSATLFDTVLFCFHNARALAAREAGPDLYLPKLESAEEAELWEELLAALELRLGLAVGTIKVTVLIETLPAVFEMDEILWALRRRVVGLNCGRWDYIFSYIKTFRRHRERILPERGQVTMEVPFLRAYSELLIRTCHRRGVHAMGGMAAQIPIRDDPEANERALARVRADKLREVKAGHDGTWVAHPALVPVARAVFDEHMPTPHQRHRRREEVAVGRDDLIRPCAGQITRAGFRNNVEVALRYLAAWLDGLGCVPIHHLMEDAATAEIARAQLWQWIHLGRCRLEDGTPIDLGLFDATLAELSGELAALPAWPGRPRLAEAGQLLAELTHAGELAEFLTLPAYERLP
ncbi:MAG: malate synthase A [Xanthomonadales bacterium]|nr:malate synthase A [Xanthomonadales bacterium]